MDAKLWQIMFVFMLISCANAHFDRRIEYGKRRSSTLVGGWNSADPSDPNVVKLAKFAVQEHNRSLRGSEKLMYSRVVEAQTQVVQGIMYRLTVEATEKNRASRYQAKVWVKEWENFKKLMDFIPV